MIPPFVAATLLLIFFFGCSSGSSVSTMQASTYAMNTDATLVISGDFNDEEEKNGRDEMWTAIKTDLDDIENSVSAGVRDSSVDMFNRADAGSTVEIDETCYELLSVSLDMYARTEGYFNPGVYYCSDLYGFAVRSDDSIQPYDRVEYITGSDGNTEGQITYDVLPDEKYVEAFRELSGHFGDIAVYSENGKFYATKPADAYVEIDGVTYSLKIDLGGIGKGYATDIVDGLFDEYGFEYGYFSFGSSSLAVRKSYSTDDGKWGLEFRDPRGTVNSGYMSVSVSDSLVSTSGDYEQYYILDGVRYCHIIDPTTGCPIQTGVITATVVGKDGDGLSATRFDAYTTALLTMGLDKAVDFMNVYLKDYVCALVYESPDGGHYVISNTLDGISIKNGTYVIGNTLDDDGNIVLNF